MSIEVIEDKTTFILSTRHSTYMMKADETGCLRHLYYGAMIPDKDMSYLQAERDRGFSGNPYEKRFERGYSYDTIGQEYSGHGTGDHRVPAITVEMSDGSRTVDLRYTGYRIFDGVYEPEGLPHVRPGVSEGDAATLALTLEDRFSGVSAELFYTVLESKDVIARAARITNGSGDAMYLSKAASLCVDHEYGDFDVIHFYGKHCMERQPERLPVPNGVFSTGSNRGLSSHHHNPFVILCDHDAGENNGSCFGYMLMYSGNHKTEIEKDQVGSVRVVTGINSDEFRWKLEPGECFATPEVMMTYSGSGLGTLTRRLHRAIRENVIDPKYLHGERPVLLNSWEACYMDFDDKKLLELAKGAKSLGIEMLVMDDGWFGKRDSDLAGLGDWYVNRDKIKCGLPELVKKVNDIGLKFGIWMEPEMVNEDSDLYRAHPDWALREPYRDPEMSRDQLPLDMSRKDVRDYLYDSIKTLLDSADIKYVKWDINRGLDNVFSGLLPADRQGETAHKYVLGLYELLSKLNREFPNVMIEGCCGGGGRFDAGILFYCPQIWCSDNTDAIDRVLIQRGTAYGYPVSAAGAHVSASPNELTGRSTPIRTRAVVAMSGTFGYELDPSKVSEEDKEEIKKEIGLYHRFNKLIQEGRYYRLSNDQASSPRGAKPGAISINDAGWQAWEFVSDDKSEALVNVVGLNVHANAPFPVIKLAGLDPDSFYSVEDVFAEIDNEPEKEPESINKKADDVSSADMGDKLIVSGAALIRGGLRLDVMSGDYPAYMFYIRKAAR